jgi:hypothetical protein
MKKYKTGYIGNQYIETVDVVRETEKCVYVKSRLGKGEERRLKITEYECYFDSFDEARAHLIKKQKRAIDDAKHRIESAKKTIDHKLKIIDKLEALQEEKTK